MESGISDIETLDHIDHPMSDNFPLIKEEPNPGLFDLNMEEQTNDYPCFICHCLILPDERSSSQTSPPVRDDRNQSARLQELTETFKRGTDDTATALLPNLKTFYFLKEIIGYPMDEITSLFKTSENPVDWLRFCQSCTQVIDESMELKRKVNMYTKRFKSLNVQIQAQVIESMAPVPEENFTPSHAHRKILKFVASSWSPVEILVDKVVIGQGESRLEGNVTKSHDQPEPEPYENFTVDFIYPSSDDNDDEDSNYFNEPTPAPVVPESCRRSSRRVKQVSRFQPEGRTNNTHIVDTDEEDHEKALSDENDTVKYNKPVKKVVKPKPKPAQTQKPKSDKESEPPKKKVKRSKDVDWAPPEPKKYKWRPRANRRKTPIDSIRCVVCREWIVDSSLHTHLASHLTDSSYIYPCPNEDCGFTSISPYHLEKIHLRPKDKKPTKCLTAAKLASGRWERSCATCSFTATHVQVFRTHLQRHETGSKEFPCPFSTCQVAFAVRQNLEFHLLEHISKIPEKNQICPLCKKNMPMCDMSSHLQFEHEIIQPLQCAQCPKLFPSGDHMITHLYYHIKKDKTGACCHICGPQLGTFKRMQNLRDHYFNEHQIGRRFDCEKCSKMYYYEETYKTHKCIDQLTPASERKQSPKLFACDLCPESCTTEDHLVAHKIDAHGAPPFVCSHCSKTFSQRIKWARHEDTHKGVLVRSRKRYKCDECDRSFKSPVHLRRHKTTHAEQIEYGFVCELCGKGYVTPCSLKYHVESVHDKVRYPCEVCGKLFVAKDSIERHMLIHKGERPFSCEVCGQRFRHTVSLNTHVKQHEKLGDKFKPHGPMKERPMFKMEPTPPTD